MARRSAARSEKLAKARLEEAELLDQRAKVEAKKADSNVAELKKKHEIAGINAKLAKIRKVIKPRPRD